MMKNNWWILALVAVGGLYLITRKKEADASYATETTTPPSNGNLFTKPPTTPATLPPKPTAEKQKKLKELLKYRDELTTKYDASITQVEREQILLQIKLVNAQINQLGGGVGVLKYGGNGATASW